VVDDSDWRLMGQEDDLSGVTLLRRVWRRPPWNPSWDHDHCAFCGAKFMVGDRPDVIHEGYCTEDEMSWICPPCFDDFRERFGWVVQDAPTA
jgi:hypothetical protein